MTNPTKATNETLSPPAVSAARAGASKPPKVKPPKLIRTSERLQWDRRLRELKQFKATHGHCRVPTSFKSLHSWLKVQRNKTLNPRSHKCLADPIERNRRNVALTAVLETDVTRWKNSYSKTSWEDRLSELKEFKTTHGHARVPFSDGGLYRWILRQSNLSLNASSVHCIQNTTERERRTKDLQEVLGVTLEEWRRTRLEESRRAGEKVDERNLQLLSKASSGLCNDNEANAR